MTNKQKLSGELDSLELKEILTPQDVVQLILHKSLSEIDKEKSPKITKSGYVPVFSTTNRLSAEYLPELYNCDPIQTLELLLLYMNTQRLTIQNGVTLEQIANAITEFDPESTAWNIFREYQQEAQLILNTQETGGMYVPRELSLRNSMINFYFSKIHPMEDEVLVYHSTGLRHTRNDEVFKAIAILLARTLSDESNLSNSRVQKIMKTLTQDLYNSNPVQRRTNITNFTNNHVAPLLTDTQLNVAKENGVEDQIINGATQLLLQIYDPELYLNTKFPVALIPYGLTTDTDPREYRTGQIPVPAMRTIVVLFDTQIQVLKEIAKRRTDTGYETQFSKEMDAFYFLQMFNACILQMYSAFRAEFVSGYSNENVKTVINNALDSKREKISVTNQGAILDAVKNQYKIYKDTILFCEQITDTVPSNTATNKISEAKRLDDFKSTIATYIIELSESLDDKENVQTVLNLLESFTL